MFNVRNYWWAYTVYNGKLVILGAFNTEEEAYERAYGKLPVEFKVIGLPYKTQSKATQIIKYKMLEDTSNLDFSLQRAKHNVQNGTEMTH